MSAAVIWDILWKKVFFKILQYLQETLVPEKTPVNFATFLRTPFLQGNCFWNATIAKAKREKYIVFAAEMDAVLTASAKTPEHQGSISLFNFYGHLPDY